jgi:hypothetical protein
LLEAFEQKAYGDVRGILSADVSTHAVRNDNKE